MIDLSKTKYICAKGCGVRLAVYGGAQLALEEKGISEQVKGVAASSGGAIWGLLFCLGYTAKEVIDIILSYDFKKFEDKTLFSTLTYAKDAGYCKGDYLYKAMQKHLEDKTGDKNATFYDLKMKGFKDLRVYSTELGSYNTSREFSFKESPHCPVALAIRYSMSIPGIYKSLRYNGKYQVDGGVTYNFPIHAFDKIAATGEVLGLYPFNSEEDEKIKPLKKWHPAKFFLQSFKASLKSQDINFFKDKDELEKTIILNTLGISSTDFNITTDEKAKLIESGVGCVKNVINFTKTH